MTDRTGNLRAFGLLALACAAAAAAPRGFADGVAVTEHGRGLGNAYTGGAASAEDASTVWWKSAGMIRLERHQVAAAGYLVLPTTHFHDAGSTDAVGAPRTGGLGGNAADSILIPSAFAVRRLSAHTRIGLSLKVPFGLSTDYGRTWRGRHVHLFIRNGPIDLTDPAAGTLVGHNTSRVDLLGVQVTLDV